MDSLSVSHSLPLLRVVNTIATIQLVLTVIQLITPIAPSLLTRHITLTASQLSITHSSITLVQRPILHITLMLPRLRTTPLHPLTSTHLLTSTHPLTSMHLLTSTITAPHHNTPIPGAQVPRRLTRQAGTVHINSTLPLRSSTSLTLTIPSLPYVSLLVAPQARVPFRLVSSPTMPLSSASTLWLQHLLLQLRPSLLPSMRMARLVIE